MVEKGRQLLDAAAEPHDGPMTGMTGPTVAARVNRG
jgi:hypothetical protein